MKRILVLVLAVSAFSVPSVIQGLGLGELELNSALNQSFDARIVLLKAKPDELDSLTIGLADMDAFRKAGIDRPFILSKLRFAVISNETGPDYIRITSPEPIREPFLDFLIEVNWSRGRLLREYTVLLDPPVYEATVEVAEFEAPEAAAAPTREAPSYAAPVEAPKMVESRPSPPAPSAPDISHDVQYGPGHIPDYAPHPAAVDGEYGPVIAGDTLWSLAKHFRPDTSVSVQQMMLALLRANPNAFSRDNVNGLYKDHILRIPDRDEVTALNKAEALAEVKGQYALWDEYRQTVASTAGHVPLAPAPSKSQVQRRRPRPTKLQRNRSSNWSVRQRKASARSSRSLKHQRMEPRRRSLVRNWPWSMRRSRRCGKKM